MCCNPTNLPERKIRHEATLSLIFISDLKHMEQTTVMRTPPKKELISRIIAVHVHFQSLHICKPTFAKHWEHGMTD